MKILAYVACLSAALWEPALFGALFIAALAYFTLQRR